MELNIPYENCKMDGADVRISSAPENEIHSRPKTPRQLSSLTWAFSGSHRGHAIYKAYVREHPHKIRPYMVQYTLHFRILKSPSIISIWDKLIELTKLSIQLVDPSVSQLTAKLSAKSRFKLAKSMSLIVKSTFILCIPIRAGKISILEFWITLVN